MSEHLTEVIDETNLADARKEFQRLTPRQQQVLREVDNAVDGWIERGFSRSWGIAPNAVHALVSKGLLEMPHGRGRARLTQRGLELVERAIQ
ncbi:MULTISPECIES: hypothetical protein [Rhodomicrobium]|uniref:hypothetical protein n=1 Tax=Rhodomicrobium TaxID=1068 RepID=UPI000B4B483A|nr:MULTISPECIES: hypothetical protein [Rhodomicrobium]